MVCGLKRKETQPIPSVETFVAVSVPRVAIFVAAPGC